jgi:hypothetical protein
MASTNIDTTLIRTDEMYATDAARRTADPATGLLLMTVWHDSVLVLTALAGNRGLSVGTRTRAAELIAGRTTGEQK